MRTVALLAVLVGCSEDHHAGATVADAYEYVPDAQCRANSIGYAAILEDGAVPLVGATLAVRGDPTRTATTDATGQFVLCAPAGSFMIDVDGSSLDGSIVEVSYYPTGSLYFPTFTAARLTEVLSAAGQTYDPTKGIVVAVQIGEAQTDVAAYHGAALSAYTSPPWSQTTVGSTLLFPNVDPGPTTVTRFSDGWTVDVAVTPSRITWVDLPQIAL